jgi:hypothetical protein
MKSKTHLVLAGFALALMSLISAVPVVAKHTHDHRGDSDWKTGMLRVSDPVWVGDVRLKSGMYHVKHVVDGTRHVIVVKSVALPAGYREFSMVEEKEVARLECRVEPVSKQVRNTKMRLNKNAAGESVILEIQIAGENFKHILSGSTAQVSNGNY